MEIVNRTAPSATAGRPIPTAALRLLFILVLLAVGASPSGARAEAASPAQKAKRHRRVRAKVPVRKVQKPVRHVAETEKNREFYEPTDGESDGDVDAREQWFQLQHAYPFDKPLPDARRKAWESRPKGRLKDKGLVTPLAQDSLQLLEGTVQWGAIGPAPTTPAFPDNWGRTSGRINAIAVKPDDANVVLVGASTGGIWRSTDAGETFAPVSDTQVDLAVGSIAFAPSNPSIVYAGMGDSAGSYFGTGVLKSTDAGVTWFRVSKIVGTDCSSIPSVGTTGCLPSIGYATRILVDPTNANRVYLTQSLTSDSFGSANTGGFRYSTDGGVTWTETVDGRACDLAISPANPRTLFLAMTQAYNVPNGFTPAVYKSTDAGQTWKRVYDSPYGSDTRDVRVAVTPADPNRVYVFMGVRSAETRIAVSTSGGDAATWAEKGGADVDPFQFGYNSYVAADPANADTVYVGTRDVYKSTDGGATFTNLTNNFPFLYGSFQNYTPWQSKVHPDQHSLDFAPGSPSTFYVGNDGGLYKTTDGGATFRPVNGSLSLTQFVGIATHPTNAGFTVGGAQDNGTQVRGASGAGWVEFAEGDGGHPVVNPVDPRAVLSPYVYGSIRRWQFNPDGTRAPRPGAATNATFEEGVGAAPRIAFYPPFVSNGADATVYFGTWRLFVSRDFADTARVDSPTWNAPGGATDLTYGFANNRPDVLSSIGVQRTTYSNAQVIYTGSSQGRAMVSRDGGATWADVTFGLPRRFISNITVVDSDPSGATVFLTVGRYGSGHVWKTTNFGQNWTDLSGTDPATKLPNIPVNALLIDPRDPNIIYVGTDVGVFRSTVGGGAWETFNDGMPPTIVTGFAVAANGNLQAATYGRGAYELSAAAPAAAPSLQFGAPTFSAGEGGGSALITVTRSGDTAGPVSVGYTTSDGTAAAGPDYTAASGTLNFAAGETLKTFSVAVADDTLDEPDETVNLSLNGPGGGASLGAQSTATLTIADNDAAPTLSVNDVTVTEGNAGTVNATFTVTLSAASGQTVTLNFATADGTAAAPADYAPNSGALTFNPGETSKNVIVAVNGDSLDEANETFNVNLSSPSNSTVVDGQGVGTITDDDGAPSLSVGDVTVTEGDAGTTVATFTVSLLPASGQAVSVNYATADGTATAGSDYAAKSGTLNFAAGETSKTVTVNVSGDATYEPDETFFVNLSAPTNATVGDAQGQGTIANDEAASTFQFDAAAYSAGEGGPFATITVTRMPSTAGGVSVSYATSDGTAAAGPDYTAASGTLNFAAGEASKTFSVSVNDDTLFEGGETINLALGSPNGGTLGTPNTAVLTISDNETQPTLQFSSAVYAVGEGGGTASITVTRTGGSNAGVSVNYATSDGTAAQPGDYTSTSGTLTFAANETQKSFLITVNDDTLDEPDETVNLTLSSPGGGAALGAQTSAALTITDDDAVPTISIGDVTVSEGNAGLTDAVFKITLSAASGKTVSVNYTTLDGTAAQPGDYAAHGGTITFSAGQTSQDVTVKVAGDTLDENDEVFSVGLSDESNATVTKRTGVGTIIDDDDTPTLSINDVAVTEGNSGTTAATFNVALSAASARPVSVNYATADGTAAAGSDYVGASGTLDFAPGETSKTVTINVSGDTLIEAPETFFVNLSGAINAVVADAQGQGTINNDDSSPGANPIDVSAEFVRQHYHDFLNREPDAEGLAFWTNETESCGADLQCREVKRINVSAAFFLSIEFQETGYLVERMYKAAYGDAVGVTRIAGAPVQIPVPVVRRAELLADSGAIGSGVIVGQAGWQQVLEANKTAFAQDFVQRQRFTAAFPAGMTAGQFVDKLFANAGVVPTAAERDSAVVVFGPGDAAGRAAVLRSVAQSASVDAAEKNRAFVLMQFFGYLQRDPNSGPDSDHAGYQFWLDKLNQFGGDFVSAEMVKAFISSDEYRRRFGQ